MAQPSERQNLDIPANFIQMDVIVSNGSEDISSREYDIGENSLTSMVSSISASNQQHLTHTLQIPRAVSQSSLRSTRSTYETDDDLQPLYMVTDVILVICAIIIAISICVSLGIFIFGQYKISRGLDSYLMAV